MLTAADTAYAIAHVRALEHERPEPERLWDDRFDRIFAAAGAHAAEGTQRFLSLPMFVEGVRIRTRFIDDFVRRGLADGLRQVVLLGAGFDARALRLPEIAAHGARVFEVDFAAQLEKKRALLAEAAVTLPPSVAYVACDFSETAFEGPLLADLRARGFDDAAGAVFVFEGVIAYLDDAAVDRSLRFVASAGGRVVFDFFPFGFGDAAERTKRLGFGRFEQVDHSVLWRRYLTTAPHENAAVACMGTAFV